MTLQITADEADLIARKLGELAEARVRRKAVTDAGSKARRELPGIVASIYNTSKAALEAKGQAPPPGAADPLYRLRMNRHIRIAKLKASSRRFKGRKGGAGRLRLVQPQATGAPGVDWFRAVKGERPGQFVLPARGSKRRRFLGGVPVSLRKNPAITARVDQIGDDLAEAIAARMQEVLKRRR